MSSDPFRDLAVAYRHLALHPPIWTRHPDLCPYGGLDGIVAAIRNDRPEPSSSDAIVRTLAVIGRFDSRAATVTLYSLAPELERRVSRATTSEYRSDALGELALVVLEGDGAGTGLAHRYVNRAHNRVHKHHHRVRHHGKTVPSTVEPLSTDRVIDYHDRLATPRDIADVVAARVDLERFGSAVASAIAEGDLAPETWTTYANHRLRVVYVPDRQPVPTRERVAAYRAAQKLRPLIDVHLQGHAA